MTHYRQPLDWTETRCREAQVLLDRWYGLAGDVPMRMTPNHRTPFSSRWRMISTRRP